VFNGVCLAALSLHFVAEVSRNPKRRRTESEQILLQGQTLFGPRRPIEDRFTDVCLAALSLHFVAEVSRNPKRRRAEIERVPV